MYAVKLICRNVLHSKSIANNVFQNRAYCYKSALCLENIYQNSSLVLNTTTTVQQDPTLMEFSGYIPIEKLKVTYSRSSGPGGQHVNTVNTKVDVRFHVLSAPWLKESIKRKLTEQYKTKITKEGYLIIRSEKTRSQQINLADALDQLRTMIRAVTVPPKELNLDKDEIIRKQKVKTARLRLVQKRMRSLTKQQRSGPEDDF